VTVAVVDAVKVDVDVDKTSTSLPHRTCVGYFWGEMITFPLEMLQVTAGL